MKGIRFALSVALFILFAAACARVSWAEQKPPAGSGKKEAAEDKELKEPRETEKGIYLNFDGYDLRKAIEYLARKIKKPIVFAEGFGGTINYVSFVPIPKENLLPVFETILNLNGWQMVEVAGMIKIIQMQQGAGLPTAFRTDKERAELQARDRIITQVFKLRYIPVNEAVSTLTNFTISRNIVAVQHSNSLIVTDYETIVLRLAAILNEVDVPGPEIKHKVVPLKYASVDTLKTYLDSYLKTLASVPSSAPATVQRPTSRRPVRTTSVPTGAAFQPVAIPDVRTNSFILIGTEDDIAKMEEFIKEVDRESTSTGNYHVVRLQNIPAKDLATTLNEAVSKAYTNKGKNEQQPVIIAFEGQNSLIILASQSQFEEIESMIEELDKPQMQVLIRTVIIEVSTSKMRELGIEFASGDFPTKDGYRGFVSTFGTSNKYVVPGVSATYPGGTGLTLGLVRDRNGIWAIPALLQAVQRDKDVELLAEPQILATDNEKAELTLSDKIPYSTISNTNNSTSQTATYGGDYEASISLKITPHIRSKDYLTLEIEQKVEQFYQSEFTFDVVAGTQANRPAKTVREAKTRVGVPNGGYIVIGGMTRNKTDETITKVPWLGDIPGIGHLFRKSKRSVEKVNLYIFLQPEIIGEPSDLVTITERAKVDLEILRRSRLHRDPLARQAFKGLGAKERESEDIRRSQGKEEKKSAPKGGDKKKDERKKNGKKIRPGL